MCLIGMSKIRNTGLTLSQGSMPGGSDFVSNAVAGFMKLDGRWGSRAWSLCGLVFGGLPWRVSGVLSTGLAICSVPNVSEQLPERAVQLLC
jgi:hypothetical protein